MPAATSCRSTGVARCAVSGSATTIGNQADNHGVRDGMAIIYLLLFAAPQVLLYLYLRERLPLAARRWRTLVFPDLPAGLDGLRVAHLSDVHAGIHMSETKMREIVTLTNGLGADLILQTGDMIDISQSFIPDYVRAFRNLSAPPGVVTVLGNHDRYTGQDAVIRGVKDAGQVFVKNGVHVIERGGATLALVGIDDPHAWRADDPQDDDIEA